MYLMQNWFNLSDAAMEDTIYDSCAMRSFMHPDFYKEQIPDATTLLKSRHLEKAGRILHGGTIVDTAIINAPEFNKEQGRQTRSRNASDKRG
ncbi:transposase [Lachnoclostridium sp. Marseille-P6806]|uniref:transposase n=1 Tax=Lachnoclostridium sp. Marseille-P6806 TaxID=2364793 RepID=UPI0013EF3697